MDFNELQSQMNGIVSSTHYTPEGKRAELTKMKEYLEGQVAEYDAEIEKKIAGFNRQIENEKNRIFSINDTTAEYQGAEHIGKMMLSELTMAKDQIQFIDAIRKTTHRGRMGHLAFMLNLPQVLEIAKQNITNDTQQAMVLSRITQIYEKCKTTPEEQKRDERVKELQAKKAQLISGPAAAKRKNMELYISKIKESIKRV